MWKFARAQGRAWMLWGALLGSAAPAQSFATALGAGASAAIATGDERHEPFGLVATSQAAGALADRWRAAQREIEGEQLQLALCDEDPARCAPEATRLLDIIQGARLRDGRARLGEINRAINLAVRAGSDMALYGAADVWRTPLALLATGAGDCEDYAIAKYAALRAAGVAADDLRIVILRDTRRHEDHAVLAARQDGRWLVLDNRRMAMVEATAVVHAVPLFVLDHNGLRHYDDAATFAGAAHAPLTEAAAAMWASSAP